MRPWMPGAWLACALTTASCASPAASPAAPQLQMPPQAMKPCEISLLPERATQADLEIAFGRRGAQIAACDAARRLAVETHEAEHALEAQARAQPRRR